MSRFVLGFLALASFGCDSIRFDGPERDWVADQVVTREASADFAGEGISVLNNHGDVEVVGVPGLSRVRLSGRPSVVANDSADAEAAFPDVEANIRLELVEGTLVVGCHEASEDHGSADAEHAGCADFLVEVPADQPVDLHVMARYGGAKVSGVSGSLVAAATFDLAASVTPISGSRVSVASRPDGTNGTCNASLALPESVAGQFFVAAFEPGAQVTSGFSSLPVATCTHYPTFTQQTVYPGTDPYPCIKGSLPGLPDAPQIELLAMHGGASLVRGLDSALPFAPGPCPVR
ncbi:MAG: hypothetical protein IPM35_24140 [Myxococcales bacterium]|nr:hypothetical protein [Myxococcales bacterium]